MAVFLFGVYSFVASIETGRGMGAATRVIEETKKAAKMLLKELEGSGGLFSGLSEKEKAMEREREARLARARQRASKPEPPPLSDTPVIFLDFSSERQASMTRLKSSPGAKAAFEIVKTEEEPVPVSARLSVAGLGGGGERFAAGLVEFPEPVSAAGMKGMELAVKSEGLESFSLSVMTSRGKGTVGWTVNGLDPKGEWSRITIPFTDFEMWFYNLAGKGYVFPEKWAYPEKIEAMNFYLRPHDLTDGKSGVLWIGSAALR